MAVIFKKKPTTKKKPPKTKYQKWYKENKAALAERRREKYHSDPAYRKRNLERGAKWRQDNKPWTKRTKVTREYLLIGEFAEQVGCSMETLRNLERNKLLPSTTNGKARRRYHPENVGLVVELVEFRRDRHYTEPTYAKELKTMVGKIKTSWRKAV